MTYIKELESNKEMMGKVVAKFPAFMQKMYIYIKKKFGICTTTKLGENEKIKVLPYTIKELMQKKKWYKKQLEKEKNIILSKKIFLNKELRIQDSDYKIYDGKWLFSLLIIQTLEYICSKTKMGLEQINVAIVVSDPTEHDIQTIIQLAQKVKSISVVTNRIAKFRKLEEKLYQEKGIAIKLSNNKKKSLKQEKIIINMDLKETELDEYQINRKSIIINIKEIINTLPKGFSGINVNYIEINSKNILDSSEFFYSHIYESKIYQKIAIEQIQERIHEDEIKISYLIGQRGEIQQQEVQNFIKMY